MTFKVLLLALLPLALAGPARVKNDQCPLVSFKGEETCRGEASNCWSPGAGDVDCANNGLCCFDGCVNKCLQEEVTFVPPPLCTVVYEQREETVTMDHCVDVPDLQTCTQTEKQNCREVCEITETPQTVQEETKCCKTTQELVCKELPCNENEHHETEQLVNQEICEIQEGLCWNKPEQRCFEKDVPECKTVTTTECTKNLKPKRVEKETLREECQPVQVCTTTKKPKTVQTGTRPECTTRTERQCTKVKQPSSQRVCTKSITEECTLVKKPVETQVPQEKCETKYREECETAYKDWCPDTREGRLGRNCQRMPYKKCARVPYEHCQHFTKTEVHYVDENVCVPKDEENCVDVPIEIDVDNCEDIPIENCIDVPVYGTIYEDIQDCKEETQCHEVPEITYVTEFHPVEECHQVPKEECTTKTITECKEFDKEECLEPSKRCNKRSFPEKQPVRNNCQVKDQTCEFQPFEKCELTTTPTTVLIPHKTCRDVCETHLSPFPECTPKTTRKQCTPFTKKMYYNVPVEKC